MKTLFLNMQIAPDQIHFLNSIIDSYEGLGNVRTIDAKEGLVQLWVMPDFLEEAQAVVFDIAESIGLVKMEWGDTMYAG